MVLDNGGSCCKVGMAGSAEPYRHAHPIPASTVMRHEHELQKSVHHIASPDCCRVFPNAVGRSKGERQSFVGEQIVSYPDASSLSLKRPFDR